jgi:diadenosine tetraphosphate (Ap4A) HIT family hydrolase
MEGMKIEISAVDLSPETLAWGKTLGQQIGKVIRAADPSVSGINSLLCDGADAGQEAHIHLHVIPRRKSDGLRLGGKSRPVERADLDDWAKRITSSLAPSGA